ncbi:hypothetical protein HMPREF9057_00031 [Actinomyces sp. oral taxon 171 str. F0337]|nr:hypothetical protein HMPREF9057_00031 [Actinomyces sp. oral taxon 171 str. F0337]
MSDLGAEARRRRKCHDWRLFEARPTAVSSTGTSKTDFDLRRYCGVECVEAPRERCSGGKSRQS